MVGTRACLASLLVLAALAGCSSGGTTDAGQGAAPAAGSAQSNDGRCQSSAADFAIGKQGTPALLEQAREASGAQIARLLKPHDMVTLEYRSERLNLNVNEQGVVNRVNCG